MAAETDFTQTVYERIHVKGCLTAVKQSLSQAQSRNSLPPNQ